jgi:hypothetical protein
MTLLSLFSDLLHRASIARSVSFGNWRGEGSKRLRKRAIPILGRVLVTLGCDRTLMTSSVHHFGLSRPGSGRPGQAGVTEVMVKPISA